MDEAAVAQAIETIEAQGKEPSIGNIRKVLGHGSLRDIIKHRKKLLPHLGRAPHMDPTRTVNAPTAPAAVLEPQVVPADAAAQEAGPPTLLAQAEAALQAALVEERRCRRAYDLITDAQERTHCQQEWAAARKAREHAANQVERLERSKAGLIAQIPAARVEARRTAGMLASIEDQAQRALLKARREAQQAEEGLNGMIGDLVSIAGSSAVPQEGGIHG